MISSSWIAKLALRFRQCTNGEVFGDGKEDGGTIQINQTIMLRQNKKHRTLIPSRRNTQTYYLQPFLCL